MIFKKINFVKLKDEKRFKLKLLKSNDKYRKYF